MEVSDVLLRISFIIIPAFFSLIIAAFWFFYRANISSEAKRVEDISSSIELLEKKMQHTDIEIATLKERYVTAPQVDAAIDKRLDRLEREMDRRFDVLEHLIKKLAETN